MKRARRGFALIFTLWILVACSAVAMSLSVNGRDEIRAIGNRYASDRTRWAARGCLERARAVADEVMWSEGFTAASIRSAWNELDQAMAAGLRERVSECAIAIRPSGLALNVNAADAHQLRRVLSRYAPESDSIADAILDWLDPDDSPRPSGAERSWYSARGLATPRNGPIASPAELALVRGVPPGVVARGILGVRNERILWRRAEPAVLAALPGVTDEALSVLGSHGLDAVTDLSALGSFPEMSAAARDSLARASKDLLPMITSIPEAWVITATASYGSPAILTAIEMRIALGEERLLILERRVLP